MEWATAAAQNLGHSAPSPSTYPLTERAAAPGSRGHQPRLPFLPGSRLVQLRCGHVWGLPDSSWGRPVVPEVFNPLGRCGFSLPPHNTACAPGFGKCCLRMLSSLQRSHMPTAQCAGMTHEPCAMCSSNETTYCFTVQTKYGKLFLQNEN